MAPRASKGLLWRGPPGANETKLDVELGFIIDVVVLTQHAQVGTYCQMGALEKDTDRKFQADNRAGVKSGRNNFKELKVKQLTYSILTAKRMDFLFAFYKFSGIFFNFYDPNLIAM